MSKTIAWGRFYNGKVFKRDFVIDVTVGLFFGIAASLRLTDVVYIAPEKNHNIASVVALEVFEDDGGDVKLRFKMPMLPKLSAEWFS